ncbi:hypothetical protein MCEMRE195_00049 [Candidatus Nanopelagicaceae bacterium]
MNYVAYVINLDSEVERWESCKSEALVLKLDLYRVSAIKADELSQSNYVTNGVQAAWKSHSKALKLFLDSGAEFAYILEDDFKITRPDLIRGFMESEEYRKWDLVQFGFLLPGIDTRVKVLLGNIEATVFKLLAKLGEIKYFREIGFSTRLRVKIATNRPNNFVADDCLPGSHFYLVNRKMASAILDLNEPQFLSIDDFYSALSKMRTFRILRSRKSAASQKPFPAWQGDRFIGN